MRKSILHPETMKNVKKGVYATAVKAGEYTGKKFQKKKKDTKKKDKKMMKQMSQLKKLVESDTGLHIHRIRNTGAHGSSVAQCSYVAQQIFRVTDMEAVLAQLRYYDPSAPSALVQADGATGTYQKEFLFSKMYSMIRFINNYQVPLRIVGYVCRVKSDTSISPSTAFTNGLADVGNPSSTSPLVYPSDSPQLADLWTVKKKLDKTLLPGQQCSMIHNHEKEVQYDPSLYDSHSLEFQKKYGGASFLWKVEGIVGHDSVVTTEQTNLEARVDWEQIITYNVRYPAGADIKYIYIDDNADASFTNGGLVSNCPVSDNQGYSLT